jgi:hypothetical protein
VSVPSSGTILYKGLTVVASSPSTGQLLAGSITITVPNVDKGSATALNATAGTAANVPDGTYTVDDAVNGAGDIALKTGNKLAIHGSTTYDGTSTGAALSTVFDADIIAVLGALADTDTVTFAGGVITAATFTATPADADAISAVLSGATVVTVGADATGIGSFTVPAGKTLEITGADLGTAANAKVTVDGTLVVGVTGGQAVTLTKAVITSTAASDAIFNDASNVGTLGLLGTDKVELADGGSITVEGTAGTITSAAGSVIDATLGSIVVDAGADSVTIAKAVITGGAANTALATTNTAVTVTLAALDTLALADGGSITIAGSGSVVAGATTCSGAGAWTATRGTNATSILITSAATGATITAPDGTAASTLTASGTAPTITQAGGTNNALGIGANVTVALGCTIATPATIGSIVLTEHGTDGGKITFVDTTSVILIDSADTPAAALEAAGGDFVLFANQATAKITVSAFADVKVHPGTTTSGKVKQITGGAAAGYLQALSNAATAASVIGGSTEAS